MEQINQIDIRPSVSILSALRHLNYKTWFALAEFVDNAIDSYLKYEKELKVIEGSNFKLEVRITINQTENKIIISDNAAGIHQKDFNRAFRTAEIPPNNTGLSEFGMGMKSASCWFSNYWVVASTALGEDIERIVTFDVEKIVNDKIEELNVKNITTVQNSHKTIIELHRVHNIPQKKTLGKVKEHLTSIYRDFFRQGILNLYVNDEILVYTEPKILKAPFYKTTEEPPILWKKEIPENFEIREGLKVVKGFVAILETIETGKSGLALFRRGRVILGSADEGFKPFEIFGQTGSFRDKRIFGELHIEGLQVSHTKDGFKNDQDMQMFVEMIADFLDEVPSLLKQAEGYRVRATAADYQKSAQLVVKETVEIARENLPKPIKELREAPKEPEKPTQELTISNVNKSTFESFEIKFNAVEWRIDVELSWDLNLTNWIEVKDKSIKERESGISVKNVREIAIRVSLTHQFTVSFAGTNKQLLTPLVRLAVAIGLSEVIARESGVENASSVRNNINKLLTEALSKQ
jgi:hypothetical protein